MYQRFSPFQTALIALGLLVMTSSTTGAELIEDVEVGIGGQFKLGHWTPLQLRLHSSADLQGQVEVIVEDGDATAAVYQGASPVSLVAGKPQTVTSYVRFGQQRSGLEVVFRDAAGKVLASRRFATPQAMLSTDYWILTVGADIPVNKRQLASGLGVDTRELYTGHLASLDGLPDKWIGLEGVDQLVLTTSQQEYTGTEQGTGRAEVLGRWVQMGGRLVISVGRQGEKLLAGNSSWKQLVPGTYSSTIRQWQTGGLEDFAGAKQRLLLSPAGDSPMTLLDNVTGVLASRDGVGGTGDRPMIVRAANGLGQVVFLAVDLDRPPISSWKSYDHLLEGLLSRRIDVASMRSTSAGTSQVAHVGYTDLTGQLRAALDQFSGVTAVSFYWVVSILVVYILFVGPLDYFVLKKFRRQHWTWVTLPLMVALCSILAIVMGSRLKHDQVLVNQLEIVDLDLTSQQMRATSWIHLYSPRARTFDLSLGWDGMVSIASADDQGLDRQLSWQGLPGSGLGGLNTRGGNPMNQSYQHGSGEIQGLPMMAASTRSLLGTATGGHQLEVTSDLSPDSVTGTLEGTFTNPLKVAMEEGVLYYGDWAFELPSRLEPGETVQAASLRETMRNLESRLTQSRLSQRGQLESGWSQVDGDVPRIAEMLMFHDAAGGAGYTHLTHRYQPWLDMSDHLNLNRAVLVGRVAKGASRLVVGGEVVEPDQQWVYYRIVLPVSPATGG
jgi:hypothetical protein